MRRAILFALLGPPLGLIVAFGFIVPAINWIAADPLDPSFSRWPDYHNIVLLPLAYFFGAVPALLCGAFDNWLCMRRAAKRVASTALFGACICFLPLTPLLFLGTLNHPIMLLYGLVGGAPAALCSYLAARIWPGAPRPEGFPPSRAKIR